MRNRNVQNYHTEPPEIRIVASMLEEPTRENEEQGGKNKETNNNKNMALLN